MSQHETKRHLSTDKKNIMAHTENFAVQKKLLKKIKKYKIRFCGDTTIFMQELQGRRALEKKMLILRENVTELCHAGYHITANDKNKKKKLNK